MEEDRRDNYDYYVIYPSETVIFSKQGKKMITCPTEEEAVDYIREIEKGGI